MVGGDRYEPHGVEAGFEPGSGGRVLANFAGVRSVREMQRLEAAALLAAARGRGVNLKRVIISSSHPADRLHQVFDSSGCLAVIEKAEPEQQAAFMMILDSIMKR